MSKRTGADVLSVNTRAKTLTLAEPWPQWVPSRLIDLDGKCYKVLGVSEDRLSLTVEPMEPKELEG